MPRPKKGTIHIPKIIHYRPTGVARVRINGIEHSLGKYGSPSSYAKYDQLIAEWRKAGCPSSSFHTTVKLLYFSFVKVIHKLYDQLQGMMK